MTSNPHTDLGTSLKLPRKYVMYYLHLLDGTRHNRDSVVMITNKSDTPRMEHRVGNSPLVNQDGVPQIYDTGWLLGPVSTETEARSLATTIAERYNYKVAFDGKIMQADDAQLGVRWITSREAQAIVEQEWGDGGTVPISSITHACREGHIRNVKKQGRDWVFRESDLWHWLNNRPKRGPKASI